MSQSSDDEIDNDKEQLQKIMVKDKSSEKDNSNPMDKILGEISEAKAKKLNKTSAATSSTTAVEANEVVIDNSLLEHFKELSKALRDTTFDSIQSIKGTPGKTKAQEISLMCENLLTTFGDKWNDKIGEYDNFLRLLDSNMITTSEQLDECFANKVLADSVVSRLENKLKVPKSEILRKLETIDREFIRTKKRHDTYVLQMATLQKEKDDFRTEVAKLTQDLDETLDRNEDLQRQVEDLHLKLKEGTYNLTNSKSFVTKAAQTEHLILEDRLTYSTVQQS